MVKRTKMSVASSDTVVGMFRRFEFDVNDYLKPGQIEQYKVVLIPATAYDPGPKDNLSQESGLWKLHLAQGQTDYRMDYFQSQGVILRQAWVDDPAGYSIAIAPSQHLAE